MNKHCNLHLNQTVGGRDNSDAKPKKGPARKPAERKANTKTATKSHDKNSENKGSSRKSSEKRRPKAKESSDGEHRSGDSLRERRDRRNKDDGSNAIEETSIDKRQDKREERRDTRNHDKRDNKTDDRRDNKTDDRRDNKTDDRRDNRNDRQARNDRNANRNNPNQNRNRPKQDKFLSEPEEHGYNFDNLVEIEGVLEVQQEGHAILRSADYNYLNSPGRCLRFRQNR